MIVHFIIQIIIIGVLVLVSFIHSFVCLFLVNLFVHSYILLFIFV